MTTANAPIDMDGLRLLGKELSNWGRWGVDDQRGCLNHITPDRVQGGAEAVRRGISFSLSIPMDHDGPFDPKTSGRFNPIHTMTRYRGDNSQGKEWGTFSSCEDMLVTGTHSTTHFDALAHLWYDDHLYNGIHHDIAVTAWGAEHCSIQAFNRGILSRGILLDVATYRGVDYLAPDTPIGPDELDAVAAAEGVQPRSGDVVLVRTGTYPSSRRGVYLPAGGQPGITWECARWMHDHEIAAVCADNAAVEMVRRVDDGSPIIPFHMLALRDMGLVLGELFDLEDLAADCKSDGVYELLFVGSPLNVPGGVGSPINPLAIK
jgi:kynurenine formamidase